MTQAVLGALPLTSVRARLAKILHAHGPTWRQFERGHLSLGQLKVMSAIEQCRSVALGGHVLRCSACAQSQIADNFP
jgi:Transposase zinc-binding domain